METKNYNKLTKNELLKVVKELDAERNLDKQDLVNRVAVKNFTDFISLFLS